MSGNSHPPHWVLRPQARRATAGALRRLQQPSAEHQRHRVEQLGHYGPTGSGLARFNGSSGYCFTTPRAAGRNAGCSFPVHGHTLFLSLPVRKPIYAGRAKPTEVTFSVLTIWGPTFSGDGNRPSGTHFSY